MTRAVLFDLYGTLLEIGEPVFQERLPRLEGISRRDWVDFQRDELLVRPFPTRAAFVERDLRALRRRRRGARRRRSASCSSASSPRCGRCAGAASVLAFLDRRGLALGLITNSASPYREPLRAARPRRRRSTSCSSPATPARASRTSASTGSALAALGVRGRRGADGRRLARQRRARARARRAARAAGGQPARRSARCRGSPSVGWLDLDTLAPLAPAGAEVELGGERGPPVGARAARRRRAGALQPGGARDVRRGVGRRARVVYLKRFLLPESIEVELAMARARGRGRRRDLRGRRLRATPSRLLVVAAAPGAKLEQPARPAGLRARGRPPRRDRLHLRQRRSAAAQRLPGRRRRRRSA